MADNDLTNSIKTTAEGPSSVSIDGNTITQQKVADQIAADRYLSSKTAVRHGHRGLRFSKAVAPGA